MRHDDGGDRFYQCADIDCGNELWYGIFYWDEVGGVAVTDWV